MITKEQVDFFREEGYLTVPDMLAPEEITYFRQVYEDFLNGVIDTQGLRSDLSGQTTGGQPEKIVQIMRPSLLYAPLTHSILHQRTQQIAQVLLGDDMELDFDMLIDKLPFTHTPTPWHQDEAYWIDMPDKRAVSAWVALDNVTKENGCMWYVPKSNKQELRPHVQTGKGGALQCEAQEEEAVAAEISAGSCTFHAGRTIHYARGNSTAHRRRAFICNYRPAAMIAYERSKGFDHLGKREVRQ
jgi:ectoine hydroxylase-related dioxygenase (phytanoyl-CoA dioxygenase family)